MASLYTTAGIFHFLYPGPYLDLMPSWIPFKYAAVMLSGIWELAAGLLMLYKPARRTAAWAVILLLIVVFPANVQMAFNWHHIHHPFLWIAYLRLPAQLLLIWWACTFMRTWS